MKTRFVPLLVALLLGVGATISHAATPAHPTYTERIALDYIGTHQTDDQLDAELAKLGIGAGSGRATTLISLVKAMRPLLDDKLDPQKDAFWKFLEEGGGASAASVDTSPKLAANTVDTEAKAAVAQLPQHLREAVAAAEKATQPVTDYHSFFHTGLRMLAPYHVTGTGTVDNTSSSTGGYLEFIYTDVWSWRPARVEMTKADKGLRVKRKAAQAYNAKKEAGQSDEAARAAYIAAEVAANGNDSESWISAVPDWRNGWDFSTRVSFNFGGSDAPSASTITGSGDFNTELSIDKHIVRGWTNTGAYCLNLGGTIGATTDKSALRVHPRYVFGPSFNLAFDDPLPGEKIQARRALFNVRAGWAYVDSVRYLRGAGVPPLTVRTVSPGIPHFSLTRGSALEAELFYPFGLQSFVTFGARAYRVSDESLSPWSLYVGITTPFSKAAAGLFPK